MAIDWAAQRRAAAWYIREGRKVLRAHERFAGQISWVDNNAQWGMGHALIAIGRRIAMGYEFAAPWTGVMYWAHLKATRPRPRKEQKPLD